MLGHPVFRAKIREWLKVLRKANCAVVLATQSLSDAARSGILDVLIESCPTKIFLPNEEAATRGTQEHPGPRDLYEAMGLNETQIEIIRSATKKRHYYLVSPEGRRLFDLGLGPAALSFAAVSSKEQISHLSGLAQREGDRWPFAWLEEKGVDDESLQ
jgi:type IV secretion system protein VirB4